MRRFTVLVNCSPAFFPPGGPLSAEPDESQQAAMAIGGIMPGVITKAVNALELDVEARPLLTRQVLVSYGLLHCAFNAPDIFIVPMPWFNDPRDAPFPHGTVWEAVRLEFLRSYDDLRDERRDLSGAWPKDVLL